MENADIAITDQHSVTIPEPTNHNNETPVKPYNILFVLLFGQFIAILNSGTGVFSSLLTRRDISIPFLQTLPTYMLMFLYIIPLLWIHKKPTLPVFNSLYFYAMVGALDVLGNYLIVTAYRYTTLVAVHMITSANVPFVLILSKLILSSRFTKWKIIACIISVAGLGVCILGGYLNSNTDDNDDNATSHSFSEHIRGDFLVLGACLCYALCNVIQEWLLTKDVHQPVEQSNEHHGQPQLHHTSSYDHPDTPAPTTTTTGRRSVTTTRGQHLGSGGVDEGEDGDLDDDQQSLSSLYSVNTSGSTTVSHVSWSHESNTHHSDTVSDATTASGSVSVSGNQGNDSANQDTGGRTRTDSPSGTHSTHPHHTDTPNQHTQQSNYHNPNEFHQRCEYLTWVGLFGTIFCGMLSGIIEHRDINHQVQRGIPGIAYVYFLGFSICLFLMYSMIPILLVRSSAVVLNLSLLTTEVYSVNAALWIFKDHVSYLYYIAFFIITLGILLYNYEDPINRFFQRSCGNSQKTNMKQDSLLIES